MAGAIVFLCFLMALVAGLTIREVALFRAGAHVISRGAFRLRLANGVVMLVVLAMFLVGMLSMSEWPPAMQLTFWALCVILFTVSLVLALIDLKMLRRLHRDRSDEIRKRILGAPKDHGEGKPGPS